MRERNAGRFVRPCTLVVWSTVGDRIRHVAQQSLVTADVRNTAEKSNQAAHSY